MPVYESPEGKLALVVRLQIRIPNPQCLYTGSVAIRIPDGLRSVPTSSKTVTKNTIDVG